MDILSFLKFVSKLVLLKGYWDQFFPVPVLSWKWTRSSLNLKSTEGSAHDFHLNIPIGGFGMELSSEAIAS
jgi:hypothetical protein